MARILRCADVVPGCNALVEGRDNAEVMARIIEHVRKDHGMAVPSFEFVTKAHAAIKEKQAPQ